MNHLWNTIHFASLGLQIVATLTGGALALAWVRVEDGRLMIDTRKLSLVKWLGVVLLWMMALGFTLRLWYEIHLLGTQ